MTSDGPAQRPAAPAGRSDHGARSGRRAGERAGVRSPRQELVAILILGALGAGLVFLALRQGWAHVRTAAPAPLPASVITVSGQSLIPYAEGLAIAALASLVAVLATRGVARRVVGVLLAGLGAGIAAAALAGVSAAGRGGRRRLQPQPGHRLGRRRPPRGTPATAAPRTCPTWPASTPTPCSPPGPGRPPRCSAA